MCNARDEMEGSKKTINFRTDQSSPVRRALASCRLHLQPSDVCLPFADELVHCLKGGKSGWLAEMVFEGTTCSLESQLNAAGLASVAVTFFMLTVSRRSREGPCVVPNLFFPAFRCEDVGGGMHSYHVYGL